MMTKMAGDDHVTLGLFLPSIQAQAKPAFTTLWTHMNPKSLSLLFPLLQQS
jgi:hypothetical protein